MVIFFVVLVTFAMLHFVYENILVPSFRLKLRFKLFELRDRLRILKLEHSEQISDELFEYLQDSINRAIKILHQIDVKTLFWLSKSIEIESVLSEMRIRNRLINECPIGEIKQIEQSLTKTVGYTLVVNNGALLFYVVPFFAGFVWLNELKKWIKILVNIPDSEASKIVHEHPVMVA